jgi:hypothetical protein
VAGKPVSRQALRAGISGSHEPLKSLAPMVNAEMSGEAPPSAQAR